MRRIAFMNQKGGVGKTTTAVNLGAALARRGAKVLLIDLDAQGNLTLHLDGDPRETERTIYDVLKGACRVPDVIRETQEPNLSMIPSSPSLAGSELEFSQTIGRETLLREAVDLLPAQRFDYLFIDCPPSLGLLTLNALAAVKEVIIPLQTEYLALHGMGRLLEVVALVRRRLNPDLSLTGILACRYDARTHLAGEVLEEAERHFPGKLFRTRIRHNVKLAEAPSHGKNIFRYASDSNGAKDYAALADEFLGGPLPAAPSATVSAPAPAPPPKAAAPKPPAPKARKPGKPSKPPAPKPVAPPASEPPPPPPSQPTPATSSPKPVLTQPPKPAPHAPPAPPAPPLPKPAPAPSPPKPASAFAAFAPFLPKPLSLKPAPLPAKPLPPVASPAPDEKPPVRPANLLPSPVEKPASGV